MNKVVNSNLQTCRWELFGGSLGVARSSQPDSAPASSKNVTRSPRRRRDAASARAAILDAAERRLVMTGPAGIRLQEVAADVGVSHPTVLHHFGSREALVKEVIERSIEALHAELVASIQASSGEASQLEAILEAVSRALSAGGHGRVLMWLALEGNPASSAGVRLSDVVDAVQAMRTKKLGEERAPPREDSAHLVVLAGLALLSLSVLGPTILGESGLPQDDAAVARFRAWLARVMKAHVDGAS